MFNYVEWSIRALATLHASLVSGSALDSRPIQGSTARNVPSLWVPLSTVRNIHKLLHFAKVLTFFLFPFPCRRRSEICGTGVSALFVVKEDGIKHMFSLTFILEVGAVWEELQLRAAC